MKNLKRFLGLVVTLAVVITACCSISFAVTGTVTWNPNDKASVTQLSNNNLTATSESNAAGVRATKGVAEGKWYWEVKIDDGNAICIGIANASAPISNLTNGKDSNIRYYYSYTAAKWDGSKYVSYGNTYATGDTVGIALDMDSGVITFYKNGVSQGIAFSDIKSLGTVFPYEATGTEGPIKITANFGATPFSYPIPDGYSPYNNSVVTLSAPVLTTVSENSTVNLSWTAVDGASYYNVKRATTSGGVYATISTTSAITCSAIGLTNGTTYYYVVSAVNDNGESENSNEVSVIPQNPDITLEVTSVDTAKVGDEITANMVIHNATNICAEDIKLTYDTTRLEFINAVGSDGIKIYKEDKSIDGIRRYITASLGKANAANGDKILLKLTFKAKAIGNAKIDITKGRIADNSTLEMDVSDANCGEKTVVITGVGDVNRSGEYTLLDLGIDAWYYGDIASATDTTKYDADQDGNGTIDDADLTSIVGQILNNSNYPASTH